jgi:hypothetical protein
MTVVIDNVKPYRGFAMGQNPQVLDKVSVEVMTYFNRGINDDKKWRCCAIDDRGTVTPSEYGKNDVIDIVEPRIIGYGATPYDSVNDFVVRFKDWFQNGYQD